MHNDIDNFNENQIETAKSRKNKLLGTVVWVLVAVIIALGAFFFTSNYIIKQPIKGVSMMPTIHDEDTVLLFRTKKVKYDDIIVFDSATQGKRLIKRVIGKPGDEIKTVYSTEEGVFHIYRNGELLSEDYIKEPMTVGEFRESVCTVPDGYYYVLGDNRNNSLDSNDGVFAGKDEIIGIAFMRTSKNGSAKLL